MSERRRIERCVSMMTVPARELRAWAKGDYLTEAAVELLIRAKGGRFARESQPWIEPLEPSGSLYRVDWDRLHEELGVVSGGERRFLNIAVSMGSPDHPVDLSNNLTSLDDELLLLVLAATAHAAGRPRLLAPASAVGASPQDDRIMPLPGPTSLRQTSTRASIADRMHHHDIRPIRRPEDERRADKGLPDYRDGLRS